MEMLDIKYSKLEKREELVCLKIGNKNHIIQKMEKNK